MSSKKSPKVLIIVDGFGYSDSGKYNAISAANAPYWRNLWANNPKTLISTSGMAVGLPEGQMGNSEVGHMTLGAGRVVYQNFTRINKAIADGDFFTNPVFCDAIDGAIANDKAVHIVGLLSPGGVHSHEDHINAMLEMAVQRGANKVYIHASLDGRDCPPRSAKPSLEKTQALCEKLGTGKIATVIGRFFSMDYSRDENDEFVQATAIVAPGETAIAIEDGDAIISMNFRPDRAREITHALVDEQFDGFARHKVVNLSSFVMTTEYEATLDLPCAYPPEKLVNSLGEFLSNQGKQQLRIAETEKYAHVTFFFSGGREALYDGEERTLIPSPDVETYDQKPEMSAFEVTEKLVEAIDSGRFDTIICNYANCDQVGHTGNFDASVKAVETIDTCLQQVIEAAAKQDGEVLITADHGNVEEMFDEVSNQPHTQHTTLPVPLVYAGPRQISLDSGGSLADIAPTILDMMGLEKPAEMSGRSLII